METRVDGAESGSGGSGHALHPGPRQGADVDEAPWIAPGIAAGAFGAFSVALFFLLIDLLKGQPLWTPATLGTALFLGQSLAPGSAPSMPIVFGYTLMHGTVFVAFGLFASYAVLTAGRREVSRVGVGLVVTVALCIGFEAMFLLFAALSATEPAAQLGAGRVMVANLLAAALMAGFLLRSRESAAPG